MKKYRLENKNLKTEIMVLQKKIQMNILHLKFQKRIVI